MIDLREWTARNAQRPLTWAIASILCLQVGYLAYLAHEEYSAQLLRIDRAVEAASLGIQQDNRPLIESALIAGLHNSHATAVALCKNSNPVLLYPQNGVALCRAERGNATLWFVRRKAVGLTAYEFVFVIDWLATFFPIGVWLAVTVTLSLSVIFILTQAQRRFFAEILGPLQRGLNDDRALEIFELDELRRRNLQHNVLSRQQAVAEAMLELSAQVAHDIRSPLAALEASSRETAKLPEESRLLIRSAVARIRDIANDLIEKNRTTLRPAADTTALASPDEPRTTQLLSSALDSLVTEKRLQFRHRLGVEIDLRLDIKSYGLFADVPPSGFKRVLSNLINNAVEALPEKGMVTLRLGSKDDFVEVVIQDDGKGIPPEILRHIGERGRTYGKPDGSGLGLHHAKTSVEAWGGSLVIESEVSCGTTVSLRMPRAAPPGWFVSGLFIAPQSRIVILDDDTSIHQIWRGRFDSASAPAHGVRLFHFSSPDDLRNWVKAEDDLRTPTLFLMDHELLGHDETGLSLAEELGIGERTVLVTSRYEERGILSHALRIRARLIPKSLAGFVPISIRNVIEDPRPLKAILIDDDELTRMNWQIEAEKAGMAFRAFTSVDEFLSECEQVERETPIYVDANLANGVNGAEESARLYAIGFREIKLTTGHAPDRFSRFTHLRGVVGKDPPWAPSDV